MNLEVFGPLVDATAIERGALTVLRTWLNTYLAEIEDRAPGYEKGQITRPRTWQADIDVRTFPENQLPAIAIIADNPTAENQGGRIQLSYPLGAGVVVRARDRVRQRDIARMYAMAIAAALMHHPDLDGTVASLTLEGFTYPELAGDADVVAATGQVAFTAVVPNALDLMTRPSQPDPEPAPPDTPDWPTYPAPSTVESAEARTIPVTEITEE